MVKPVCDSKVYKVRDIDRDGKPEMVIEDNVCRDGELIVSGKQRMVLSSGRALSDLKSVLNGNGDRITVGQTACQSNGVCFELNGMDDFVTDPPDRGEGVQHYVDMLVRVTDEGNGGSYLMDVNTLEPEGWVDRWVRRSEIFVKVKASAFGAFVSDMARTVKGLF